MSGPPPLPPHLSYKSALILSLPESHPLHDRIQRIRKEYDSHVNRWPMAHVTLIFPFLTPPPSLPSPDSSIPPGLPSPTALDRLGAILSQFQPFVVRLETLDHFQHSRKSSTVYIEPTGEGAELLVDLQGRLEGEFREELGKGDGRGFHPHLSLGQGGGEKHQTKSPPTRLKSLFSQQLWGSPDPLNASGHPPRGSGAADEDVEVGSECEWLIDRVQLVYREGYKDPMRVVGELSLGGVGERETEEREESRKSGEWEVGAI
ncbi:2'-5' RNA ligase superfamily-domain-containing protein [Kalaharituber pfeilii]|nr:2'-5' RNA ligase superfamily-domain-containing protein [Kalaharituber pfeilii]